MFDRIDNVLYPELARFPSRHQRDEALVRARREAPVRKRIPLKILVPTIAIVLFGYVLEWLRPNPPVSIGAIAWAVGLALMWGSVYVIFRYARGEVRKCLRAELSRAGVPTCVECGYDLRNIPEWVCPECGIGYEPPTDH